MFHHLNFFFFPPHSQSTFLIFSLVKFYRYLPYIQGKFRDDNVKVNISHLKFHFKFYRRRAIQEIPVLPILWKVKDILYQIISRVKKLIRNWKAVVCGCGVVLGFSWTEDGARLNYSLSLIFSIVQGLAVSFTNKYSIFPPDLPESFTEQNKHLSSL